MPHRTVAISCIAFLAPLATAQGRVLSNGEGPCAGHRSLAGTGHGVRFEEPSGTWWLRSIRIYGGRYGGGYDPRTTELTIWVRDAKGATLTTMRAPYALFEPAHGGKLAWVNVPLEVPLALEDDFEVIAGFDPTRRRGVYVGWRQASGTSHSAVGLPDHDTRPFEHEWMIEAVLTDRLPKNADVVVLEHGDGHRAGHRSLGGSGHVIEFDKPRGTWYLRAIELCGSRYGAGYDPAATEFRVSVCATSMNPLHTQAAPYGRFPSGEPSWVRLDATARIKMPARFRVAVDFAPTGTRGVYLGYTSSKRSRSFTGLPSERAKRFEAGDWQIRAVLTRTAPDLPRPGEVAKPDAANTKTYLDDFEFLRRTVARSFPALQKKNVDWKAVCAASRKRFEHAHDDREHLLNVHRLLATLSDSHTGVTGGELHVATPAFAGLYGAGLWIAVDRGRLVLRALVPGHPLAGTLGAGAELLQIDGRPARLVLAETRRQVREWAGFSSQHFLDARLSFQMFPFGTAQRLPARFLTTAGKTIDVTLSRWGPGGHGADRQSLTMPEGIAAEGLAAAGELQDGIGYVRILGSMNDATQRAFFAAFDRLRGARGIVLDCRGMGGGSDPNAWAMAGRFFEERTPNGTAPALQPTGDWQFDGPVVMLQDEREASSAETFTWAMAETGRVLSIGRPTAGVTIIPRVFALPSGIARFRLGVHDRATPIGGVQPEGIGTPPDVLVPYEPDLLAAERDPILAVGVAALRALLGGAGRDAVTARFRALLEAEGTTQLDAKASGVVAYLQGPYPADVVNHALRQAACQDMPEVVATGERLLRFAGLLERRGDRELAQKARAAVASWSDEAAAQRAFEQLMNADSWPPPKGAVRTYLQRHGKTRYGQAVRAWSHR